MMVVDVKESVFNNLPIHMTPGHIEMAGEVEEGKVISDPFLRDLWGW
ncbi:MAG: hypothetical protein HQK66_12055 [Desulfamplus sp.]|nr:hypothetical protein [Desulfamplus sp.]